MSGLTWAQLEDALLSALQAGVGLSAPTLRTYQGNWREDLRRQAWRLPAVLLVFTGSRAQQVTGRSYDLIWDFQVVVALRRLRGDGTELRGEGGVYQLLAGIRQALWHQDLGLDILPMALLGEQALLHDQEFLVYGAHYRTAMVQDISES